MAAPKEVYWLPPQDVLRNHPSNQTCAYQNQQSGKIPFLLLRLKAQPISYLRMCHSLGGGEFVLYYKTVRWLFTVSNKHKSKVMKRQTTACLHRGSHQALTCKLVTINYGIINSEPEGKQQKLTTVPGLFFLKTRTSRCRWFLTF